MHIKMKPKKTTSPKLVEKSEYEKLRSEIIKQNAQRMHEKGLSLIANKLFVQANELMKSTSIVEETTRNHESSSDYENEENVDNLVRTSQNEEPQGEESDGENLEFEIATTTSKSVRRRGPSKGVKTVGQPMFLEFDALYNPKGKWGRVYGVHIGTCAQRTDINIESYSKLSVVELNKNWEETRRLFNIQEPGLKMKEKKFHSQVATRFRNWKTKLRRHWLAKDEIDGGEVGAENQENDKKQPWVTYAGLISEVQWKTFAENYYSDKFQAISQKARASGKQNDLPHHMGQNSYYVAEEKWIKDGRLSPPNIKASNANSSIAYRKAIRPKVWKLAHEKKLANGKWGIDPSAKKIKDIAEKIDQVLEEEAKAKEDGTFVEVHGMDALSKALGKRDHRGRVKAIGGIHIGIEKVFGKSDRKGEKKRRKACESTEELTNDQLQVLKSQMEREINERVAAAVERALKNRNDAAGLTEKDKGEKQCKYILAPYHEGNHWSLLVIELQAGQVFVFDSLMESNDKVKDLAVSRNINLAYKIYIAIGGKRAKMNSKEIRFIPMECPQQPGGTECGYYTMKFMLDFVTLYSGCSNFRDSYSATSTSYSTQEINVVREQWSKFFTDKYLLS